MSNVRAIHLEWEQNLEFRTAGTQPPTPSVLLDGDGVAGPSPMLTLLMAAASCSASDVVLILEKMRVSLERLTVDVTGTRRTEDPKRYVSIEFAFAAVGKGLTQDKADRAVALSIDKYCSVVHSLAPDIGLEYSVTVEQQDAAARNKKPRL